MSSILIVEDNAMNMKLARDVLEAKGYRVLTANNGTDGVRVAREEIPDLILMDIQLPDVDGIEAFSRIRQDPKTAGIRVVAFTASVTKSDRSRVDLAGFDGFVSKPMQLKPFLATIQGLLGDGAA
jgi:two-component system, cell cycle response regulator DivK